MVRVWKAMELLGRMGNQFPSFRDISGMLDGMSISMVSQSLRDLRQQGVISDIARGRSRTTRLLVPWSGFHRL